jgi:DNA transposition AAA+ family ATPase
MNFAVRNRDRNKARNIQAVRDFHTDVGFRRVRHGTEKTFHSLSRFFDESNTTFARARKKTLIDETELTLLVREVCTG